MTNSLLLPEPNPLALCPTKTRPHPLDRVFARLRMRGCRNHYLRALRRVLTSIEHPGWAPAYPTEPLPVTKADVFAWAWENLTPDLVDEGLRQIEGTGSYNLAATALRLVAKEYLRSIEDRIEEVDDLLEELAARPERKEVDEHLRASRLRLRHQRRGLRLTLEALKSKRRPVSEEPAGRALTAAELAALYRACDADPCPTRGARQAALVTLLLVVRRFELARLEVTDIDPETGAVLVRAGKGGKTAQTWIPEQGLPSVRRWLELCGDRTGTLLELTYEAIYREVRELGDRASIGSVSPHDLRRTACTLLLAAGVKPHLVQKQMRHTDFATTQRYDHSQRDEVRSAVAALPLLSRD